MCDEGEGKPNPAFYSGQLGLAAMIQQALARRPTGPSHQTRQRADDLGIAIPSTTERSWPVHKFQNFLVESRPLIARVKTVVGIGPYFVESIYRPGFLSSSPRVIIPAPRSANGTDAMLKTNPRTVVPKNSHRITPKIPAHEYIEINAPIQKG